LAQVQEGLVTAAVADWVVVVAAVEVLQRHILLQLSWTVCPKPASANDLEEMNSKKRFFAPSGKYERSHSRMVVLTLPMAWNLRRHPFVSLCVCVRSLSWQMTAVHEKMTPTSTEE
jgi:hypothetical protein